MTKKEKIKTNKKKIRDEFDFYVKKCKVISKKKNIMKVNNLSKNK